MFRTLLLLTFLLSSCSNNKQNVTDLDWQSVDKQILVKCMEYENILPVTIFTSSKLPLRKVLLLNASDFSKIDSIIFKTNNLENKYPRKSHLYIFREKAFEDTLNINQAIGMSVHSIMPQHSIWFEYYDFKDNIFHLDSFLSCITYPLHCDAENIIYNYKGYDGNPYIITVTADTTSIKRDTNLKDELYDKLNSIR